MRAILCGYYGKGNGGDEALLASLLQMLPDNIQPYVLSGNPSETKQRYQVEAGDRLNTFTILQAMRRSDIFIWGVEVSFKMLPVLLVPFIMLD